MERGDIFRITGADRRRELIRAIEQGEEYVCQKPGGEDVEYFSPDTGFVLLRKMKPISHNRIRTERVKDFAEFSLETDMALREFYYAMGSKTERFKSFMGTSDLYRVILSTIDDLEIICDLNREKFTMGNFPKGFIFYEHDYDFGNPNKKIGMTEDIAKNELNYWTVRNAQSIIQLEKMAAANRLVEMGFSSLTNSVLSTTSGNFTRAVYALTNRFVKKKPIIFFCDGDAYGNDMLRSVEFGTQASRHLTPDQAFPSSEYDNIHIAGLFPSVAERLGIPNDDRGKRPMQNKYVRERIEFLQRYNLIDERDLATWKRDKTYEMEAMSTEFVNAANDPVGLGIYLTEFMRINDIPCKPRPPEDDGDVEEEFEQETKGQLDRWIRSEVKDENPADEIVRVVESLFEDRIRKVVDEVYRKYIDNLQVMLDGVDVDQIRDKIWEQYQEHPKQEHYLLGEISKQMFKKLEVNMNWDAEELVATVEEAIEDYLEELGDDLVEDDIEFQDLPAPSEPIVPFYDIVEREIGADPSDCEKVREELKWRLDIDE